MSNMWKELCLHGHKGSVRGGHAVGRRTLCLRRTSAVTEDGSNAAIVVELHQECLAGLRFFFVTSWVTSVFFEQTKQFVQANSLC